MRTARRAAEFLERRMERLRRGPGPVVVRDGGKQKGAGGGTKGTGTKRGRPNAAQLAALIDRNGGNGFGALIVEKADAVGLPLVLACALVDLESTFRNVFGHDRVPNPIPKGSKVTKESYARYLAFRQQGRGNQGVGLTQLTFHTIQDAADRKGGCYRPAVQLEVGFQLLSDHMKRLGREAGIRKYNGDHTKDETLPYLEKFEGFVRKWSTILGSAGTPADGRLGKAPRTLRRGHEGRDVALLQRTLNRYYREWGAPDELDRDGDLGKQTVLAYLRVAAVLGLEVRRSPKGRVLIPVRHRRVMRDPARRTPEEVQRARTDGAEKERRLRERFARERRRRGRRPKVIDLGSRLSFRSNMATAAPIHTVVGHHTACSTVDSSDKEALARCARFHGDHQSKGWAGIGYHVCIARSGTIILLRPGDRTGAGVENHNTGLFHVAFIGDYRSHEPSDAQLRSYRWLLEHGHTLKGVPRLPKKRRVHRDFRGHESNICAGPNLIPHLRGG